MTSCATSCELMCETGAETCDVHLYDLFPAIIRYKDALAQGGLDAEGTLEKITYMLEQEVCITRAQIADLATLLDADEADPDFLLYLSATLGTMVGFDSTLGIAYQRWLIKSLVAFHKIKGTHPSWDQRFGHFFRNNTLSFWYRTWELWKRIPYENYSWSRYQDYYHTLRAARYDIYYLDGDGNPVFLDPDEAQALLPYTNDARPIHVLPRFFVQRVNLDDTLVPSTEDLTSTIRADGDFFTDQPDELTDNVLVDITCGTSCETGSCEGYCELSCTAAACEFACQMGCTTGIETSPFPGPDPDFPGYPGYSCRSSCEAGSCEFGCQIGSCQSGCQSSAETEKYPAHIGTVSSGADDIIPGRIWFPHPGMTFPPVFATDPWWITPAAPAVNLKAEKVGTGQFGAHTLIPDLRKSEWVEVTCAKGNEVSDDHGFKGNGVDTTWNGTLNSTPHPGSVRIEAVLTGNESDLTVGAAGGSNTVFVADSALFHVGDEVQVTDDDHAEPNFVVSIVGGALFMRFALRTGYTVVDNGKVLRVQKRLVAHTIEMLTPPAAPDVTHWYGELGGDVDETAAIADRRVNYRGVWDWNVTFREPPSIGATITAHWIREQDCEYWIEQVFQGIDSTSLKIDGNRNLGFTADEEWCTVSSAQTQQQWAPTPLAGWVETLSLGSFCGVDSLRLHKGHVLMYHTHEFGWYWAETNTLIYEYRATGGTCAGDYAQLTLVHTNGQDRYNFAAGPYYLFYDTVQWNITDNLGAPTERWTSDVAGVGGILGSYTKILGGGANTTVTAIAL